MMKIYNPSTNIINHHPQKSGCSLLCDVGVYEWFHLLRALTGKNWVHWMYVVGYERMSHNEVRP